MKSETLWYPSLRMLFHHQHQVSSTMDAIKNLITEHSGVKIGASSNERARLADFFCFSADMQTRGRGTYQSKWHSPTGNLHLTIAARGQWVNDSRMSEGVRLFPVLNSLCIFETTKRLLSRFLRMHSVDSRSCMRKLQLKWPNDILYENKKLAGTLVEQFGDWYLIGIGVNVLRAPKVSDNGRKTNSFAKISKIHPTATQEHNMEVIRRNFAQTYAKCLRKHLLFPDCGKLRFDSTKKMLQVYEKHLAKGIVYRERQGNSTYKPIGIDADGALVACALKTGKRLTLTSTYPF